MARAAAGPGDSGSRRRAPRPALRIAATLGAGVLGFLAVELVLRVFDLGPPPPFERQGGLFRPSGIAEFGFENRPGATQRLLYRSDRGAAPEVIEMRVNAQGFRGAQVELEKRAGLVRIACIGDSHTFGWGVREGESWPDHLARELARRYPRADFEVLNCGVNNYDTVQEIAWLEHRVLPYAPDLVLLQFYVNDASVHGVKPARPRDDDAVLRWTDPERESWLTPLRTRSRFADLVCDFAYRRRGLAVFSSDRTRLYDDAEPGWRLVRDSLRRARELCRARELPFAVALYPFLLREGDALTSHRAFEIVRAFCAAESIPCIDAEPAFVERDVDRLRISPHDYHGNAEANRIFAGAVCRGLDENGLLAAAMR